MKIKILTRNERTVQPRSITVSAQQHSIVTFLKMLLKMRENISASCFVDTPSFTYNRYLFDFEKNHDYWQVYYWFVDNWSLSCYIVGVYFLAIIIGQHLMKGRQPFQLKKQLLVWNIALALISFLVLIRCGPVYYDRIIEYGFYGSMCYAGAAEHKQAMAFWAYVFTLAKVLELGDTALIVLMKKPLHLVHWFHHASVLLFTWYSFAHMSITQLSFMLANVLVHVCMYSYLALKAMKAPMPKAAAMAITILELIQLVFSIFINIAGYLMKLGNDECCIFDQSIVVFAFLYLSYLLLFTNFFIKSYVSKKPLLEIMGVRKEKTD